MKKNIRNITLGLTIIMLVGISSYTITLRLLTTSVSNTKNEVKISCATNGNNIEDTRYEIAASIHLMANGLIVAEDNAKNGVKSMSMDELNATYNLIQTLPTGPEKTNFINIINRWKACDFSQIVSDHNTVWRILGQGQPENILKGRAISADESTIKSTINLIKRGDYSKNK
ncbi:DUF6241 domain-containing protein [Clostridium drakei]|uniref:Uncharacterized protein n=1 Tax=Clostridium drakei TaxID=332101 RepID=A0A2U8DJY0_9CLOT|nr:DUF6241 domain-containing protein [Clostridium drakei]AWI03033.1 hypothetical protein B9W14_00430 [Clostridium drakei]